MNKQISLTYKEPIKPTAFVLLITLLLLTGVTAAIFYPPNTKLYRTEIFHSDTPRWLFYLTYVIVIFLISLFFINKFCYGFFIYYKANLIRRKFGLPIEVNKFIEITGISKDWFDDRKIYISAIDKKQLVGIIRMYNVESEDIFRKISGWYWILLDNIFGKAGDFIFKRTKSFKR